MSLSKNRQIGNEYHSTQPLPAETDLQVFEVFTQKMRGQPHVHAGALHAPDAQTAVQLACEHYGQDEACAHLWVVDRRYMVGAGSEDCPINKAIEHNYRYARDYKNVRHLWKKFRTEDELKDYEKDELKEAF